VALVRLFVSSAVEDVLIGGFVWCTRAGVTVMIRYWRVPPCTARRRRSEVYVLGVSGVVDGVRHLVSDIVRVPRAGRPPDSRGQSGSLDDRLEALGAVQMRRVRVGAENQDKSSHCFNI
jgi:hypothetical protein